VFVVGLVILDSMMIVHNLNVDMMPHGDIMTNSHRMEATSEVGPRWRKPTRSVVQQLLRRVGPADYFRNWKTP
jgi:hypothetical protein